MRAQPVTTGDPGQRVGEAGAAPLGRMEAGRPDSPTVRVAGASSPVQAPLGAEGGQGLLLLGEHSEGGDEAMLTILEASLQ